MSRTVTSLPPVSRTSTAPPRASSVGIVVVRASSTPSASAAPAPAPAAPRAPGGWFGRGDADASPWWVWVFGLLAGIYGFNLVITAALTDWSRTVTFAGASSPTYVWPLVLAPLATGALATAGAATCWRDAQQRMMRMGVDVTRDVEALVAMPLLTLGVVADGAGLMRFTELAGIVGLSIAIVLTATASDFVARGAAAGPLAAASPSSFAEVDPADARVARVARVAYRAMPIALHGVAFACYAYMVLAVPRDADAAGAGVRYAMRVVLVGAKVVHVVMLAALSFAPSPRDYTRLNVAYYGAQCATRATLALLRVAA